MAPPGLMEHVEIVWEGKGRAAKAYAPGLGCRDTLRWRMLSRSFSATKESTWSTMSLRKVPIKSLPRRVSRRGMSSTAMSTPFSLVSIRHCSRISL